MTTSLPWSGRPIPMMRSNFAPSAADYYAASQIPSTSLRLQQTQTSCVYPKEALQRLIQYLNGKTFQKALCSSAEISALEKDPKSKFFAHLTANERKQSNAALSFYQYKTEPLLAFTSTTTTTTTSSTTDLSNNNEENWQPSHMLPMDLWMLIAQYGYYPSQIPSFLKALSLPCVGSLMVMSRMMDISLNLIHQDSEYQWVWLILKWMDDYLSLPQRIFLYSGISKLNDLHDQFQQKKCNTLSKSSVSRSLSQASEGMELVSLLTLGTRLRNESCIELWIRLFGQLLTQPRPSELQQLTHSVTIQVPIPETIQMFADECHSPAARQFVQSHPHLFNPNENELIEKEEIKKTDTISELLPSNPDCGCHHSVSTPDENDEKHSCVGVSSGISRFQFQPLDMMHETMIPATQVMYRPPGENHSSTDEKSQPNSDEKDRLDVEMLFCTSYPRMVVTDNPDDDDNDNDQSRQSRMLKPLFSQLLNEWTVFARIIHPQNAVHRVNEFHRPSMVTITPDLITQAQPWLDKWIHACRDHPHILLWLIIRFFENPHVFHHFDLKNYTKREQDSPWYSIYQFVVVLVKQCLEYPHSSFQLRNSSVWMSIRFCLLMEWWNLIIDSMYQIRQLRGGTVCNYGTCWNLSDDQHKRLQNQWFPTFLKEMSEHRRWLTMEEESDSESKLYAYLLYKTWTHYFFNRKQQLKHLEPAYSMYVQSSVSNIEDELEVTLNNMIDEMYRELIVRSRIFQAHITYIRHLCEQTLRHSDPFPESEPILSIPKRCELEYLATQENNVHAQVLMSPDSISLRCWFLCLHVFGSSGTKNQKHNRKLLAADEHQNMFTMKANMLIREDPWISICKGWNGENQSIVHPQMGRFSNLSRPTETILPLHWLTGTTSTPPQPTYTSTTTTPLQPVHAITRMNLNQMETTPLNPNYVFVPRKFTKNEFVPGSSLYQPMTSTTGFNSTSDDIESMQLQHPPSHPFSNNEKGNDVDLESTPYDDTVTTTIDVLQKKEENTTIDTFSTSFVGSMKPTIMKPTIMTSTIMKPTIIKSTARPTLSSSPKKLSTSASVPPKKKEAGPMVEKKKKKKPINSFL